MILQKVFKSLGGGVINFDIKSNYCCKNVNGVMGDLFLK